MVGLFAESTVNLATRGRPRNPAVFNLQPGERCHISTRSSQDPGVEDTWVPDLMIVYLARCGVHKIAVCVCVTFFFFFFRGIAMVIDVPKGTEIKARAKCDRKTWISPGDTST